MAKQIIISLLFIWPYVCFGQGTSYLSTLNNPNNGGATPVASDQWAAELFQTGTAQSGYFLNSIELSMSEADFKANGFSVSLYSDNSGSPGNYLNTLNGSSNPSSGIYTYNASNFILLPTTSYWVVVNAGTPYSTGVFYLNCTVSFTASYTSSDNWSIPGFPGLSYAISSDGGSSWGMPGYLALFTVNATMVPEPTNLAFIGLGLTFLWTARQSQKNKS
ncbi:MAG TPA: choice-of-anchor R domain-containing protein [Verrucomicrobiae bacterium]|nr:choice-of-anchor R domain-containing protein [Verrucomicrobiae bacterium]